MALLTTNIDESKDADKFSPRSKFIQLVEYDSKNRTMDITFTSGTKVRYTQVFENTFLSFKQSPTHDAFYSNGIKKVLPSFKLIDKSIGREESVPLKKVTQEKTLDRGLAEQRSRQERIQGTINRAFAAANAESISSGD